jgi:hypothetical protein
MRNWSFDQLHGEECEIMQVIFRQPGHTLTTTDNYGVFPRSVHRVRAKNVNAQAAEIRSRIEACPATFKFASKDAHHDYACTD